MTTFSLALQHERLGERVHRLRAEISHLEHRLGGDPADERLRRTLTQSQTRRRELELQLREIDRDTEARRQRATARERELMNPRALSPASLMKLRQEVDHLREALGAAEDAELALLEQADVQDAEIRSLETEINARTSRSAEEAPGLDRQLADAAAEAAALEEEAAALWAQLPAEWQSRIDRVHAHHPDAVAEVRDGLCQGCHVALPSNGRQALHRGGLLQCDNCGRLLGQA